MKKILSVSLIHLSLLLLVPVFSSTAHATELSDRGQNAIEQIATCINSDGKNELNILYLIDESASLRNNDPGSLRAQGLIRSLEQFKDVSTTKPYFKVKRAITTFGDKFTVHKGWKELTPGQLQDDIDWIGKKVSKLDSGQYTDWNKGLKGAFREFARIESPSACSVMVWFTDGGIQVGRQDELTQESLSEICGYDPLTGSKNRKTALIDLFRNAGINIQGVLLRNQQYIDDPESFTKGQTSKEQAAIEIARMSFFRSVVEQEGTVDDGAFSTQGPGVYQCGANVGAGGVHQIVDDPIDIIWPPIQFSCLSTNGRVLPISKSDGAVKVDAALTRFTLTSFSQGFSLKNSEKIEIANSKGASKGDVSHAFITKSQSVVQVAGKISSGSEVTKPGIWTVKSSDIDRAVFCGYLDLQIDLKVGTCYIGEQCNFTGSISRIEGAVKLKDYKSIRVTSSQLDEKGQYSTGTELDLNPSDASFAGFFTTEPNAKVMNLKISLQVLTQTGIEFTLGTIKPISIIPPGRYPEITPAPISAQDFSQNLIGKQGQALVAITLKAPTRTNGEICIGPLEVRSDINPERIKGYSSELAGFNLAKSPCFQLQAGGIPQEKLLSIKNSDSADGDVSGYFSAVLKSDGEEDIVTKVDVKFVTSTQKDEGKFRLLFALLMLLGLALPLILLAVINSRNSRIILDNIYKATIPVTFSASGNFVSILRNEKLGSTDLLSREDFIPFSSGKEVVRSKAIGGETLKGKAPKNPFGTLQAHLTAAKGLVIVSSAPAQNRKSLAGNVTQGSLNPSGLMYVTLPESGNEELKLANQAIRESKDTIKGTLTVLLSLNSGDPVAQVDYLNTRLAHEAGWLNGLLSIAPSQIGMAQESDPKEEKLKKKSKNADVPTQSKSSDEWRNSSGSPQSAKGNSDITNDQSMQPGTSQSGDDWGSTGSSSGWDSPGTSGDSSKSEEW